MIDVNKWVGMPYTRGSRDVKYGLDCWGLAVYIYKDAFGIDLPLYETINPSTEKIPECSDKLIKTESYRNFETVLTSKQGDDISKVFRDTPVQCGDLILFNVGNHPIHIGIILDQQKMIHTFDKTGSSVERFLGAKWINRIASVHRHRLLNQPLK